jgi:hypothetical protein
MKEVQITHPDGTRATYRVASPSTLEKILAAKPKAKRLGPGPRSYPKWHEAMPVKEYLLRFRAMNPAANCLDYGISSLPDTPAESVPDEPIVDLGPEGGGEQP